MRHWLFLFIAFAYLSSAFIQFDFTKDYRISGLRIDFPRVLSGDEPHYLAMVNSLVSEGDLRLLNNYESAMRGESCATGENHRGKWTDTRIHYFDENNRDVTLDIFFVNGSRRPGKEGVDVSVYNQVAIPPFGMPVFVSLFAWPFEGSCGVESVAVLLSVVVGLFGLWFLFLTLQELVPEKTALLVTFVCAFGTPFWFYARSLYPQVYIAAITMAAFYLVVQRKWLLLPAILLGFGYLTRYPFVLVIGLFWLYVAKTRSVRDLIKFSVPLVCSELVLLAYNYSTFGTVFAISQSFSVGDPWTNLPLLFIHPLYGLLVFVPVAVFMLAGMRSWLRSRGALLGTSILIVNILFYSLWANQGGSYATRYLLDNMLLLFVPVGVWLSRAKGPGRFPFIALAAYGIILNSFAGLFPALVIGRSPWEIAGFVIVHVFRILRNFFKVFGGM
ncbi:glycosyltransferase family 39 protein [Candidatus Woesearchaeota archaeon]|nr:glycosyltransferase family 39 protein [Candidatus Woesearchaeota archaeon]